MSIVSPIISSNAGPSIGASPNPLVFHALAVDPAGYKVQNVLRGTGDLTEARTGSVYQPDHEGIWREFATTVPAYRGGRVVENLVTYSEDFSNAAWIKLATGDSTTPTVTPDYDTAPDGSATASRIQFALGTSGDSYLQQKITGAGPRTSVISVYIRSLSGAVTMALGDGAITYDIVQVTTSWQRIAFPARVTASADMYPTLLLRTGQTDTTADVLVWGFQAENAEGQSNQAPGEYIPTTTAAVQKVFASENGNTVAANVVTEAVGAALASPPWLYGAPAATNEIIWSRDLTNWTQTGTAVSAYNAVGLTGAANTATTLTDDDGAAHEYVQTAITVPDDSNPIVLRFIINKDTDETRFPEFVLNLVNGTAIQTLNIDVNTKTGAVIIRTSTGTVDAAVNQIGDKFEVLLSVANNGTGNTSAQCFAFPARGNVFGSITTAATGSIIVGNVELYLNTTIDKVRGTSPIFTAGATASVVATNDSFDDANHTPGNGGYFVEWTPQYATSEVSGNIEIISLDNAPGLLYYDATNSLLKSTDGTNTASVALTVVAGTTYKIWVAYGDTRLQVGVDATTGTEATFDGAFATGTKIEIVTPSASVNQLRNLRHYNSGFTSSVATLQTLAA